MNYTVLFKLFNTKNTPLMERVRYVITSCLFHKSDSFPIHCRIAQILLKNKKFSTQFLNFLFDKSPFQLQMVKDFFTPSNTSPKARIVILNPDSIRSESRAWILPCSVLFKDSNFSISYMVYDRNVSVFSFRGNNYISLHEIICSWYFFPSVVEVGITVLSDIASVADPSNCSHS